MARSDLDNLSRAFAGELQKLLNSTVADTARVVSVGMPERSVVSVGTNLDRSFNTSPVCLRSTSSQYKCWLDIQMRLFKPDDYLTVQQSYFAILATPDAANPLFHYDYERDKAAYTEAHVQVFGSHADLDPMIVELSPNRKKKKMGELHFPVGGRRFRPALEDVIEFLIDEGLADPKPGWKEVLEESRATFRRKQLKASVRRDPDAAAEVLRTLGYKVVEPSASIVEKLLPKRRRGKQRTFDDTR